MRITKIVRDDFGICRLNFFMDNLHYSIQYDGDCGEWFLILRCKETKEFIDISDTPFKAQGELNNYLFGWDFKKKGNTYKSFNLNALEEKIRGKLRCRDLK